MTVSPKQSFPDDPILVKLLQAASRDTKNEPIVCDDYGFEKTYAQLLGDILQTRSLIIKNLPPSALNHRGVLHEDTPYICVLAISGYEFLVAFFAIRALGGACIPFSSGILQEEASYFISNSNSACLLSGRDHAVQANKIDAYVKYQGKSDLITLPISSDAAATLRVDIEIDDTLQMDPGAPGLVLFTSGTTGPPKGAVLPKRCFAFQYMSEPGSGMINYRPSHWIGGAEGLLEPIVTGAKVYSVKERVGAKEVWELFRNNHITHVLFTPSLLRTMKEHYADHITQLSAEEQKRYVDGFKNMTKISCCSAMLAPSILRFWTGLTGLPFENVYGGTEAGGPAVRASIDTKVTHSIGTACPGVKVRLSEGDHGEIRFKSPSMITHYIGDEEKTASAFDEEGYFKTGDLAKIVEGEYVFTGRASVGYVFFHGYRIATLEVENSLIDLPYIAEAYVVGVPDYEAKELCAALIRIRKNAISEDQLSLAQIRTDLSQGLPTYKLPMLLRILKGGEEVPMTISQKPIRREIVKQYFGVTDHQYWSGEDPTPGVQSWGNAPEQIAAKTRPWDWCGLQRAD